MLSYVREFCRSNNICISEDQEKQLEAFTAFVLDKNKVMNLTAITDPEEFEVKHLVDSIEAVPVIEDLKNQPGAAGSNFRLIDIGCGAGFPGIPLKIMFPEADFTLLDSLHKRIDFVEEAYRQIGLSGISAAAARAEEYADEQHRETFDFCVSRAVAEANVLLEYCLPLVNVGGYCILYKSDNCMEELDRAKNAVNILGGMIEKVISCELPAGFGKRSLVIIRKIGSTPAKYPRRTGKPSKSPL